MSLAIKAHSQEELLISVKKGDTASFCALYDAYAGVLFGSISKLCNDAAISEEILQRSFITIWQNIASYNAEKHRFLAWMLAITRNIGTEVLSQKLNKNSKIQTVTNSVNDNNKEVLLLVYFKGYSLQKAAEILNISVEEVKMKLKTEFDLIRTQS